MRIAIDARMMNPLSTRGIGRYSEELVRGMVEMDTPHRFVLLMRNPEASPFQGKTNVEHLKADIPWYGVAEQLRMPRLYREANAELVHAPHWNVPIAYRGPFVVTIHDLLLRHQPASAKASTRHPMVAAAKKIGYRMSLCHVAKRASAILVPTQFVADEMRTFYPSTADRLIVTGEGISVPLFTDAVVLSRSLPPLTSYLLYVGSAYPHKRLDLLLDVWAKLAARHPELHLVIAGEEDVFMARYVSRVHEQNLPRVRFLGRVSEGELSALYDHARAFVFPSSHEGFGLPPLEALAHGCPVISSDAPCMLEVLPKSGVSFFRNGDADGMMKAIDALLRNTNSAQQDARGVQSLVRDRYRWSRVAERTIESYERVVRSFHASPKNTGQKDREETPSQPSDSA
jgi:glycosyltransferase involved in cell wall biosynthesis